MDLLKNLDNMITAKLILTGKETYDSEYSTVSKYDALEAMIKFAKYHVEQALTEASKTTIWKEEPTMQGCKISFVKSKILNAYPLENIK